MDAKHRNKKVEHRPVKMTRMGQLRGGIKLRLRKPRRGRRR